MMKISFNRRNVAKFYRWCTVGIVLGVLETFGGLVVAYMTINSDKLPTWFLPWFWISMGSITVLCVLGAITGKMIGKSRRDWW
jgi:hypothetical protein